MDNDVKTQDASRESEAALIGAVLRNSSRFQEMYEIVKPDDFKWQCYGFAWRAMYDLFERGMGIDTITLGDELHRMDKLGDFMYAQVEGDAVAWKGRAALGKVRENGDPRNIEAYASRVKDYSGKRSLLKIFNEGATWAMNGRMAADIVTDITKLMSGVSTFDNKANIHTQSLAEAVSQAYDETDKAARGELVSIKTGYVDLDNILHGMSGGDLLIVAARPGQGKTALLSSVVKNVAEDGKRVLVCTLEMQNKQIAMRLIAMESGISYDKQKSGGLEERDWPLYTNAVEKLADNELYKIILNDLPSIRPSQMRQEVRRAIAELGGLDLLAVDYIGLAGSDGKYESRALEVSNITRALKGIAKEFDIPVLAAAQLSRAVEQRAEKRPILSDLKESGGLEENADVVMFIYRPDQYEKDTSKQNIAEIIVAKHRNGRVGSAELIYRSELTRFESAVSKRFNPNESRY